MVTLIAGSWESPVNRDPIAGGYVESWVGILLAFLHQRGDGEAKGKLRAWSYREHALLRTAVVALPPLIIFGPASSTAYIEAVYFFLPSLWQAFSTGQSRRALASLDTGVRHIRRTQSVVERESHDPPS